MERSRILILYYDWEAAPGHLGGPLRDPASARLQVRRGAGQGPGHLGGAVSKHERGPARLPARVRDRLEVSAIPEGPTVARHGGGQEGGGAADPRDGGGVREGAAVHRRGGAGV